MLCKELSVNCVKLSVDWHRRPKMTCIILGSLMNIDIYCTKYLQEGLKCQQLGRPVCTYVIVKILFLCKLAERVRLTNARLCKVENFDNGLVTGIDKNYAALFLSRISYNSPIMYHSSWNSFPFPDILIEI